MGNRQPISVEVLANIRPKLTGLMRQPVLVHAAARVAWVVASLASTVTTQSCPLVINQHRHLINEYHEMIGEGPEVRLGGQS